MPFVFIICISINSVYSLNWRTSGFLEMKVFFFLSLCFSSPPVVSQKNLIFFDFRTQLYSSFVLNCLFETLLLKGHFSGNRSVCGKNVSLSFYPLDSQYGLIFPLQSLFTCLSFYPIASVFPQLFLLLGSHPS